MGAQLSAISTFGALIGDIVGEVALAQSGKRIIGDLYPHIVTEEVHEDRLQITTHPIATGTPVTDHSYLQPQTVEIRCGWSNSSAASVGFVQAVYQQLLRLQETRQPFSIRTGKRGYTSMLIASLGVKTDAESEYALMVIINAQQIIITNTAFTSTSASPMTNGETGIATPNSGANTPISGGADPAPTSSLSTDSTGAVTWPNDPALTGTLFLTPNPNAQSWADLNTGITSSGALSQ